MATQKQFKHKNLTYFREIEGMRTHFHCGEAMKRIGHNGRYSCPNTDEQHETRAERSFRKEFIQ